MGNVRTKVFGGFLSTGKTYAHGYGLSRDGQKKVEVHMRSKYDPGLGFTMLCACTVAAQTAQRMSTSNSTKPGFNSAVVALGGDNLAAALLNSGVSLDVS